MGRLPHRIYRIHKKFGEPGLKKEWESREARPGKDPHVGLT